MTELGPWLWLLLVAGGAVLLGVAIAIGFNRDKHRTTLEKHAAEAGTKDVYRKE